jgi:hypothetical protein
VPLGWGVLREGTTRIVVADQSADGSTQFSRHIRSKTGERSNT